ncbi:hypothetical protein BH10CYA1_BH10CYA1_64270 [soil metagenome]
MMTPYMVLLPDFGLVAKSNLIDTQRLHVICHRSNTALTEVQTQYTCAFQRPLPDSILKIQI